MFLFYYQQHRKAGAFIKIVTLLNLVDPSSSSSTSPAATTNTTAAGSGFSFSVLCVSVLKTLQALLQMNSKNKNHFKINIG